MRHGEAVGTTGRGWAAHEGGTGCTVFDVKRAGVATPPPRLGRPISQARRPRDPSSGGTSKALLGRATNGRGRSSRTWEDDEASSYLAPDDWPDDPWEAGRAQWERQEVEVERMLDAAFASDAAREARLEEARRRREREERKAAARAKNRRRRPSAS